MINTENPSLLCIHCNRKWGQKAQTQGAEGPKTQPVSPGTRENVDLSSFAMIFPYWFAPSAFWWNSSLEEQGMLPGVTNTSSLGKFQSHAEPQQVFLKQLFLLFYTNIFSTCKPLFGIQDNKKNVKTCPLQLNHGVLETWCIQTFSFPPSPQVLAQHSSISWFSHTNATCSSSFPTPTDFSAVVTQHLDFQRQHIVQLSPVIFNYHLWSLHKAARGWSQVCSQSCCQGFHGSFPISHLSLPFPFALSFHPKFGSKYPLHAALFPTHSTGMYPTEQLVPPPLLILFFLPLGISLPNLGSLSQQRKAFHTSAWCGTTQTQH